MERLKCFSLSLSFFLNKFLFRLAMQREPCQFSLWITITQVHETMRVIAAIVVASLAIALINVITSSDFTQCHTLWIIMVSGVLGITGRHMLWVEVIAFPFLVMVSLLVIITIPWRITSMEGGRYKGACFKKKVLVRLFISLSSY